MLAVVTGAIRHSGTGWVLVLASGKALAKMHQFVTRSKELAVEIIGRAIQRYAAEHSAETTTAKVQIPDDDMKGRIIGKEGRNIRAFEQATGVDLIIDDTPGIITVSCFDGVRREFFVPTQTQRMLICIANEPERQLLKEACPGSGDSDGDGQCDSEDQCPTRFGLIKPVDTTDPAVADVIADWADTQGTVAIRIMMNRGVSEDPADPGITRVLKASAITPRAMPMICG